MRLKLHDDAKWIASHAWSFRFLVLAAVLTGAEAAMPLLVDHSPVPRRVLALVMFLVVAFALIARLIVQQHPPELFDEPKAAALPATGPASVIVNGQIPAASETEPVMVSLV